MRRNLFPIIFLLLANFSRESAAVIQTFDNMLQWQAAPGGIENYPGREPVFADQLKTCTQYAGRCEAQQAWVRTIFKNPDFQSLLGEGGASFNTLPPETDQGPVDDTFQRSSPSRGSYQTSLKHDYIGSAIEKIWWEKYRLYSDPLHLLSSELSEPFDLTNIFDEEGLEKSKMNLLCSVVVSEKKPQKFERLRAATIGKLPFGKHRKAPRNEETFPYFKNGKETDGDWKEIDKSAAQHWPVENYKACYSNAYGFRRPLCITEQQFRNILGIIKVQRNYAAKPRGGSFGDVGKPGSSPLLGSGSIHTLKMGFKRLKQVKRSRWSRKDEISTEIDTRTLVCVFHMRNPPVKSNPDKSKDA